VNRINFYLDGTALLVKLVVLLGLMGIIPFASAYETDTHGDMSRVAVNRSVLSSTEALAQLGLKPLPVIDSRQTFPSSVAGQEQSIVELVRLGAVWEDGRSKLQALRHFYDPINDRALTLPDGNGSIGSLRSPDWALEDNGDFDNQSFSYKDARSYLYNALTGATEVQRKKFFGLTFQTLGHVIHHLQDMAQPQHVRNDPHCDSWICQAVAAATGSALFYAPSQYEKYTNLDDAGDSRNQIRRNLPYAAAGSDAVYRADNIAASPFKSPRLWWRTTAPGDDISGGWGIAEYTNRNFYSAGTIGTYPSPAKPTINEYFSSGTTEDVKVLLPGTALAGTIRFWPTQVTDSLTGTTGTNSRAISEAVFDSDIATLYPTAAPERMTYALNRFTFDAAHQFLIPRAVGYSAGLINYFFRGQLELGPPDEGVYGVIDHTVENLPNIHGFRKIKVKLRNVTPGGHDVNGRAVVEAIPTGNAGSLVAVVKFHRNACYQPSLAGEYGAPGINWRVCRSAAEEIAVSSSKPVPEGLNDAAQPMVFDFAVPIPINATDLYLQVVYRGPLGSEPDAVAVATRDIAEPTYVYQYSRWDQYLYANYPSVDPGPNTFQQWCAQGFQTYADCRTAMGLTWKVRFAAAPGFAGNSPVPQGTWSPVAAESPFDPVVTMTAPVGTYGRVAVLTDPGFASVIVQEWIDATHGTSIFRWDTGPSAGTKNQFDFLANTLDASRVYTAGRGIYVFSEDSVLLNSGTAANIPPLAPVPSVINF